MIRKNLVVCGSVLLLGFSASAQTTPLPCTPAKQGDTQPWTHNSKVLNSFPRDKQLPRFIGTYRDKNKSYMLDLYQDAKGIFGELSSPVFDADSPTSRLYDVAYNSQTGKLKFNSRFADGNLQFNGVLRGGIIEANVTRGDSNEKATLKRVKPSDAHSGSFKSQAEFECAMTLWRRF
jgi:hypothetical protein